jgi:hypothetical protein
VPLTITAVGGLEIRCENKVEGIMNLAEDIRKIEGSIAGILDKFETRNCTTSLDGRAGVRGLVTVAEPWDMVYRRFSGTLPRITEVLFEWEMALLIETELWNCLFEGRVPVGTSGRQEGGTYRIERFTYLASNRLPLLKSLRRGIVECPAWIVMRAGYDGERIAVNVILI